MKLTSFFPSGKSCSRFPIQTKMVIRSIIIQSNVSSEQMIVEINKKEREKGVNLTRSN